MKKIIHLVILILTAAFSLSVYRTDQTLRTIEHTVIRLHIRANSDSLEDQTLKLRVRDAILKHAEDWLQGCQNDNERRFALAAHLSDMEQIAAETLRDAGEEAQTVSAAFGTCSFPERSYGDVTLPAGDYEAVTISLGNGTGQNWWCVMYPALCLPAALTHPAQALSEEAREMTEEPERYEIRLKCVELYRAVSRWLRGWFA